MRLPTSLDRYPGKMVAKLATHLVGRYAQEGHSVFDPFCGSGAILVAADRAGLRATGVDVNPLAPLFCHVKLRGFDAERARSLARTWIAEAKTAARSSPVQWAGKNYWFTKGTLDKFERLRAVSEVVVGSDVREREAVLLSYALAVRLCSRADQRSPKPFISKEARRARRGRHFDPNRIMLELLEMLSGLYGGASKRGSDSYCVSADVCQSHPYLELGGRHSHAITSPPYINAQDYFRNFKLELYLLEDILPFKVKDVRERFVGTERGELMMGVPGDSVERDWTLVPALRTLRDRSPRLCAVVHRYFYDMSRAFDTVLNGLEGNGCLVVVCGDNIVGGVKVCTWGVLHAILEEKGFRLFDRFTDPIRDRLLPPTRLGHRALIKEEVISAYRLGE